MKFGSIPPEDLAMTTFAGDTSAGAVVIGDFGFTRFTITESEGFTYSFTRHIRIKFLDKKELHQADFSILLWVGEGAEEEKLSGLKAYTFNLENGKEVRTKLENNAEFREVADKNHNRVKFSLPNVKEGSVIDVTYSISSPYLFNLTSWQFQSLIPTLRSEYHMYIPEYFNYKNWTTGYVPIQKTSESKNEKFLYTVARDINSSYNHDVERGGIVEFEARVDHWSYMAENVPAFIPEPFITAFNDYLAYVDFELLSIKYPWAIAKYFTTTWEKINEEMMDDPDFGKQLKRGAQFKELLTNLDSSVHEPQLQMIWAYETIKNKLIWDGRYRVYPTIGIYKAFTEGGGSSSDVNLNLVALLREIGLNANPVLVSTRSNGMLKPGQVILSQFNHVIAAITIADKLYLLDATDPYCPYFMLPPNDLNDKGLMLSEKGFKWVDLYSKLTSQQIYIGQVTMTDDLEVDGKLSITYENFAALAARKEIKAKTNLEEYKKDLESAFEDIEISDLQVTNLDSLYKPIKLSMNIHLADKSTEGAGMVYFNPVLFERQTENLFKKDTREYPVDFNYPFRKKYTFVITIPDGYEVIEYPKAIKAALPENAGKFSYVVSFTGKTIVLNCEMIISQTIFPTPNYLEIKKFYEIIVAKMAEQIVLKKLN